MNSTNPVEKSNSQPDESKNTSLDKLTDEEACVICDILWREISHCKFYRVTGPLKAPQAEIDWYEAHGKWIEQVYHKLIKIINVNLLTPSPCFIDQQKEKAGK